MEIKDIRFSATSTVGAPVRFSDIGCAVIWRSLQCARDQMKFDAVAMVRDYRTGEEAPMEEAFFVINSGLETPMGYGVAAFREREEAESFVSENARGRVLTYAGLLEMKFE
jgi:copper chaperone NosL